MRALSDRFPPYTTFGPEVPVRCVTPGIGRTIHRFYDTSPFSPSGRFLGLTRLPSERRAPRPGEMAEVVVIDLETGDERVVATTRGWSSQVGAHVQWGAADADLFFNDLDPETWRPFAVHLDPRTGARRKLEGPVYMASPDGRLLASPCLVAIENVQPGYGVKVPDGRKPVPSGAAADSGVFVTDVASGTTRLLVSLREIVERAVPRIDVPRSRSGGFCAFHVKWNPQGDRLLVVLHWLQASRWARSLLRRARSDRRSHDARIRIAVTMSVDGTDVRVAVPDALWKRGGHHPNWCPDGRTLLMNLRDDGEHYSLMRIGADGRDVRPLCGATGSGHPTMHPDGRHVLTDAYLTEPLAHDDGTVPIRLIDTRTGIERQLIRIDVRPPFAGRRGEMRVDPHPAWDRDFRRVAFNACADGTRRVYVADLSAVL